MFYFKENCHFPRGSNIFRWGGGSNFFPEEGGPIANSYVNL